MEIKDRHLLLVAGSFVDGKMVSLSDAVYFKSKWERELGERLKYEGETFYVGAIAESREEILALREDIVRLENKKRRKEAKELDRKLVGGPLVEDLLRSLKEYKF
jgi:hypothetical protein